MMTEQQQRYAARLTTLLQRANYARWAWLQTGNPAYRRIADRAMDQLKEEARDA